MRPIMSFRKLLALSTIFCFSACYADNHRITDVICSGNAALFIDGKSASFSETNKHNAVIEDGVMIISGGKVHTNLPRKLQSISLHDNCQLRTKHWDGRINTLVHNTSNDVVMDGFFSINKILKTGQGRLVLFWLDGSNDLVAKIDSGKAYLAGQVKRLILRTTGDSHFNGQHLISRRVLLKSIDQSTAQVHPLNALTVFSLDQSHVGYVRPVSYSNLSSSDQSSIVMEPFRQN